MSAATEARGLRFDFPITLVIALAGIATTALVMTVPSARDALVADDRVFAGEGWRLVTGALVHATWGHLVRDLSIVLLLGIAYEAVALPHWLFGLGLVVPSLAEVIAHRVAWYCGLSGLSHALLAAVVTYEALRRRRLWLYAVAAVAIAKPLYELVANVSLFPMPLGVHVADTTVAHAAGAFLGIIAGVRAARASSSSRASVRRPDRRPSRAAAARGDRA